MKVFVSILLLSVPQFSIAEWFIDLPSFQETSNIQAPLESLEDLQHSKYQAPEITYIASENWNWCGWSPPLSESDQILMDPKTIHFEVGQTYERYIPIMGMEPVEIIRTMRIVDRKFDALWSQ